MIRKLIFLFLFSLLSACAVVKKPISTPDRYAQAKSYLQEVFSQQEPACRTLSFSEALARGLKYNLDYRIKLTNIALQAGQLEVAAFTMFPALNASGSVYKRNNKYASFGITSSGQPTDVLTSTPNTIRSARVAMSWNILDFGLGYVRAQQQGERIYIAQEESRKQLQQLSQEILVAYWDAYSAQQMMVEANEFQTILSSAKRKLSQALHDPTVPKESILNYEAALLDGSRHIIKLKYKYDKAMLDLKHLLNLPPDIQVRLTPPPLALRQMQDLHNLDFRKLDAITLSNRPELRGQAYQERIAKMGVHTAILQALPGVTLNEGWNYNSNKFLLNTIWVDRSLDVAWNLLNLASLPYTYKTAKTQVEYEKLKSMALTLSVLTETRYAFSHYESLRNEYVTAKKQTENAREIYELNKNRRLASLGSEQQVVTSKLRTLTAKMDEDLLLSDLSTALGELYLSAGSDILPTNVANLPLPIMTKEIQNYFIAENTWNFRDYVNNTYHKLFGSIPEQYTLELYRNKNLVQIKQFKNALSPLPGKKSINCAKIKNNGDNYVLTYGRYASAESAAKTIKKLPKQIQLYAPSIINTDDLQWVT